MDFARLFTSRLQSLANLFPVLALTGARQARKTTLLRAAFPGHNYVSLDLPSMAEQAELNPGDFLSAWPPPLLIDEVQYAPALFRMILSTIACRWVGWAHRRPGMAKKAGSAARIGMLGNGLWWKP